MGTLIESILYLQYGSDINSSEHFNFLTTVRMIKNRKNELNDMMKLYDNGTLFLAALQQHQNTFQQGSEVFLKHMAITAESVAPSQGLQGLQGLQGQQGLVQEPMPALALSQAGIASSVSLPIPSIPFLSAVFESLEDAIERIHELLQNHTARKIGSGTAIRYAGPRGGREPGIMRIPEARREEELDYRTDEDDDHDDETLKTVTAHSVHLSMQDTASRLERIEAQLELLLKLQSREETLKEKGKEKEKETANEKEKRAAKEKEKGREGTTHRVTDQDARKEPERESLELEKDRLGTVNKFC